MSRNAGKFAFAVNGKEYRTDNAKVTGRELRTGSGHNPAPDWCLIQVGDGFTALVGLEALVELEAGTTPVFHAMRGDHVYEFTVEDRGWEWGGSTIAEPDVRAWANIPASCDLMVKVVGKDETLVLPGGVIELDGPRIERIYSRGRANAGIVHVSFVVGGELTTVEGKPDSRLVDLLEQALALSENTGQGADRWQVSDEHGGMLDVGRTFAELGLADGVVVLASLKTGGAG